MIDYFYCRCCEKRTSWVLLHPLKRVIDRNDNLTKFFKKYAVWQCMECETKWWGRV